MDVSNPEIKIIEGEKGSTLEISGDNLEKTTRKDLFALLKSKAGNFILSMFIAPLLLKLVALF